MTISYKDAGVDIDAGAELVEHIKPLAKSTHRREVLGDLGGFAGLFALSSSKYREPVLVSGTDGVGTKLKSALAVGRHDYVGIDLVAMCVNDVIVTGAEPLFFLDYFATGRLDVAVAREVISGIAEGCRQAGCALLGGETAELPGMYHGSDYDLAGFCVGVVERDAIPTGADIAPGDVVLGLPSAGLHSNGHSLARKVLLEVRGFGFDAAPEELRGATIADELLRPTIIYVAALRALADAGIRFKGAAHITGGGLIDNPPRMLRTPELAFRLDTGSWDVPPVFPLIAAAGVQREEMFRTFNMGIGMVLVVERDRAEAAAAALSAHGARVIGEIIPSDGGAPVRLA